MIINIIINNTATNNNVWNCNNYYYYIDLKNGVYLQRPIMGQYSSQPFEKNTKGIYTVFGFNATLRPL